MRTAANQGFSGTPEASVHLHGCTDLGFVRRVLPFSRWAELRQSEPFVASIPDKYKRQAPDNIQKVLIQQANSSKFYEYIYQRIQDHIKLEDNMKHGFIFVYGIGDIFPYLRTNVFLTNYERYNQTDKYKLIVFYPGHQVNNSFSLFDLLDDSNTYRATLLLNENNE